MHSQNVSTTPEDKTQFFVPIMEHPSTMPGKEILPDNNERVITDKSYCNGLPIKDFDVSNPIPNQGIIVFVNKYKDLLWVKNAHWVDEENNGNGSLRLFQEGDAELLMLREGKWYYHFGYSISEATSFGWNIYSRSDGQFELGLVGGNRTLYALEELPYKMPEDRFKVELIDYNGRKANYHGQMENNLPNGFGFIDSLNVVLEFGFWKRALNGQLVYTSLSNSIKDKINDDEQFWGIFPFDNWILFQSLEKIYAYNTKTKSFTIVDPKSTILKAFKTSNGIYFQTAKGLYEIDQGKSKLFLSNDIINQNKVINILDTAEGLLLVTQKQGIFRYQNGLLTRFITNIDAEIQQSNIYSSQVLSDESIALGSISMVSLFYRKKEN
ncbi:MAG: hypothetical protein LRY32_06935 [Flavobacterium sp.]|nr:hypothetical protein [Flavobacterium sp.]